MNKEIKRIDIKEFREQGYLQEANRLFFHPLGLALESVVEEDGTEHLGGVWDSRDDPEGILFDEFDYKKSECVKDELLHKRKFRCDLPECSLDGI